MNQKGLKPSSEATFGLILSQYCIQWKNSNVMPTLFKQCFFVEHISNEMSLLRIYWSYVENIINKYVNISENFVF